MILHKFFCYSLHRQNKKSFRPWQNIETPKATCYNYKNYWNHSERRPLWKDSRCYYSYCLSFLPGCFLFLLITILIIFPLTKSTLTPIHRAMSAIRQRLRLIRKPQAYIRALKKRLLSEEEVTLCCVCLSCTHAAESLSSLAFLQNTGVFCNWLAASLPLWFSCFRSGSFTR